MDAAVSQVSRKEIECHRLASEIEWIHARELSRRSRGRGYKTIHWDEFYDQHAATELGNLIFNRLFTTSDAGKPTENEA